MDPNEKDVSTEQPATQTHARVPYQNEHGSRPRRPQTASQQGAQTPDRADSTQTSASLNPGVRRYAFPKATRLLLRREFLFLQHRGKRRYSPHFVVISAPTQGERSRLGITTSRHFGKAVIRNRVRRMLREFFRIHQAEISPAQDILIIPKVGADTLSLRQVTEELERALFFAGKKT